MMRSGLIHDATSATRGDQTRSPASVSRKREYSPSWPETFGEFAP
jgi:hypothetical protein